MACEHDGKKNAAPKKLTAIQCRFEAGASKRKDLDPEYGGAAHDWTSSNLDSAARKWLKHLK